MDVHLDAAQVLARFDALQQSGEDLLFTPRQTVIRRTHRGFDFEYRVVPSAKFKPQFPVSSDAASVTATQPITDAGITVCETKAPPTVSTSDIDNGDAAYHLAHVNATHRLIFNKYCIYRPQYILLTTSPAHLQTSPLSTEDFSAAWTVLQSLESSTYIIFNCGQPAGGSRMHKHMQVFEKHGNMLPDLLLQKDDMPELPYHYSLRAHEISVAATSNEAATRLRSIYAGHVRLAARSLCAPDPMEAEPERVVPHNMILTREWIMTIPRRKAGVGAATANSAGMLGLVWVPGEEVVDLWEQLGPLEVWKELGVPSV